MSQTLLDLAKRYFEFQNEGGLLGLAANYSPETKRLLAPVTAVTGGLERLAENVVARPVEALNTAAEFSDAGDVKEAYEGSKELMGGLLGLDGGQALQGGGRMGAGLLAAAFPVLSAGMVKKGVGKLDDVFTKYGANVSDVKPMGGALSRDVLNDSGDRVGGIVYRETPDEIVIEGLRRGGRNADPRSGKGQATRAVKALIEDALSKGKRLRADSAGGAGPYWSGSMGFRKLEGTQDYVFDASQAAKIKSGEITTTAWPHPKGYGDAFKEYYGPMLDDTLPLDEASRMARDGDVLENLKGDLLSAPLDKPQRAVPSIVEGDYFPDPDTHRGRMAIQGGPLNAKPGIERIADTLDNHGIEWEWNNEVGGITAKEYMSDGTFTRKHFAENTSLKTLRNWLGY